MAANRRLKQARVLQGWSQARVAEQIGTDATTVSRWERGLFSPTPYFRERLCALFDKNAEQLGLLENTDQLPAIDPALDRRALLAGIIGGQAGTDGTRGEEPKGSERGAEQGHDQAAPTIEATFPAPPGKQQPYTAERHTEPLVPPFPSWSKRSDTFTYILSSTAHDRHAHMLWEDAYVHTLRGQHETAQQLGEASLQAFARVGHINANYIREWLDQGDLIAPQPPTIESAGKGSRSGPLSSHPPRPQRHKSSIRRIISVVGSGLVLLLIIASTLILSGHTFNQLGFKLLNSPSLSSVAALQAGHTRPLPSATSLSPSATPAPSNRTLLLQTTTPTASSAQPTPVPTRVATTPPTSSAQPPAISPTIMAQVTPESLTASSCFLEPLGYRCTLTLSLFTPTQGTFTWHASSVGIAVVQFNPATGSGITGKPIQVIVYMANSSLGRKGQLIFTFTFSAISCTNFVSWQG